MITPTTEELGEYKKLWDEFKSFQCENPKSHVDTEVIKKIITPLPVDDPMRAHADRLIRYNRFLYMSTRFAAFFFQNIDINIWSRAYARAKEEASVL